MKKFFLFCMMALVAMCGLNSCSDDCDHDFIEHDHSADLVGTWTCLQEGLAEAFVIKADGSVVSTGVLDGEYWDGIKGSIKTVNNKMTFTFEGGDNYETRFDIIPGVAFSIFNEEGERLTYNYCANDLADEIVGMWVCNDASSDAQDMMIQTFYDNGKCTLTGYLPLQDDSEQVKNEATDYKVIGDLLFISIPAEKVGGENPIYVVDKLVYTPNGTAYGDMLSLKTYPEVEGKIVETTLTFLRVKQNLNLTGKKYNYSKNFVSNVKGLDKDIEFMGYTMNFAKMDGSFLDKMLKMFNISFPDANTMHCVGRYSGGDIIFDDPIVVEGNKMTVKMSQKNPAFKDVDLYAFQDQDNTQFHIYMSTTAFINFFGNMQVTIMEQMGQLDTTDAAAVKAVFDSIDEAVESINLSLVMHSSK